MENTNKEAYSTPKLDSTGLSQVWAEIVKLFATKDYVKEWEDKLGEVEKDAQVNVIEGVQVNGVDLEVLENGKKVNVLVPSGKLASLDKVGKEQLNETLTELITAKAEKATTLEGYGIKDAYTKTEADTAIKAAVDAAIVGVYVVKGSVEFADIPTEDMHVGDVYNVKDSFTTTDDFLEGEGIPYQAGTNIVYTADGWDCMAGVYDFSSFMMKSDMSNISSDEIKSICVLPNVGQE